MDCMAPNEINTFWDRYETGGIEPAMNWLEAATGNYKALEGDVPGLIREAREREVDLVQFIKEMDEFFIKESNDDTIRTNDDGDELRTGVSSEAGVTEDQGECSTSGADDTLPDSKD